MLSMQFIVSTSADGFDDDDGVALGQGLLLHSVRGTILLLIATATPATGRASSSASWANVVALVLVTLLFTVMFMLCQNE